MSAEHFSGIRHRRGGVVVIGVVTAVTTALQAPTAAAQSPEAPLDLTCTVTSPGLPAALAVPDVPATLDRRPDQREGDATDMGPAPTDPVDSRGELTLRLPAGLGDLLAAHLPGARPSPEGLRINVDIAAEGEATGGEAGAVLRSVTPARSGWPCPATPRSSRPRRLPRWPRISPAA
ncbi:hypothetical protein ACFSSF_15385 [Dietzia aerolata]|uniref:hypothetical protein n=1 Tax=Dietzia aerolata TaxID=595984 RepID=UPI00362E7806